MNTRTGLLLAAVWLVEGVANPALAQSVEVTAALGPTCVGSESSMCHRSASIMWMGQVGVVQDDRWEVAGRIGRVGLPDLQYAASGVSPEQIVQDRSRLFLVAQLEYRFLQGKRVRPFIGAGFGSFRESEMVTCPGGCLAPGPGPSRHAAYHTDLVPVFGLVGRLSAKLRMRFEVDLHNPAAEHLSTVAYLFGVGYVL
jgi:hypothetical protein